MFSNQVPYFKRGNILKKEMLANLRDYPRDFLKLYFQDYSEGIISGVKLTVDEEEIELAPGIIKFADRIYTLEDPIRLDYTNSNQEVVIKAKFLEPETDNDFKVYDSQVWLAEEVELADNELELGRFKLRQGANLRSGHTDFADFATEYNTINLINVKYANLEQPTLHPLIINSFAKRLWQQSGTEQLDLAFAMTCFNSRVVARELIVNYLVKKLEIKQQAYTNQELYNYLKRIIAGLGPVDKQQRKDPNKIIVN